MAYFIWPYSGAYTTKLFTEVLLLIFLMPPILIGPVLGYLFSVQIYIFRRRYLSYAKKKSHLTNLHGGHTSLLSMLGLEGEAQKIKGKGSLVVLSEEEGEVKKKNYGREVGPIALGVIAIGKFVWGEVVTKEEVESFGESFYKDQLEMKKSADDSSVDSDSSSDSEDNTDRMEKRKLAIRRNTKRFKSFISTILAIMTIIGLFFDTIQAAMWFIKGIVLFNDFHNVLISLACFSVGIFFFLAYVVGVVVSITGCFVLTFHRIKQVGGHINFFYIAWRFFTFENFTGTEEDGIRSNLIPFLLSIPATFLLMINKFLALDIITHLVKSLVRAVHPDTPFVQKEGFFLKSNFFFTIGKGLPMLTLQTILFSFNAFILITQVISIMEGENPALSTFHLDLLILVMSVLSFGIIFFKFSFVSWGWNKSIYSKPKAYVRNLLWWFFFYIFESGWIILMKLPFVLLFLTTLGWLVNPNIDSFWNDQPTVVNFFVCFFIAVGVFTLYHIIDIFARIFNLTLYYWVSSLRKVYFKYSFFHAVRPRILMESFSTSFGFIIDANPTYGNMFLNFLHLSHSVILFFIANHIAFLYAVFRQNSDAAEYFIIFIHILFYLLFFTASTGAILSYGFFLCFFPIHRSRTLFEEAVN